MVFIYMMHKIQYLWSKTGQYFYLMLFSFLAGLNHGCQNDVPFAPGNGSGNDNKPNIYDWTFQNSDLEINFTDVSFIDSESGWIVGENNTILSTTVGGQTWPQAPVNSIVGNFRSVYLVDDRKGWISGDLNGQNLDGNIYISINGGSYPESQITTTFPMNVVFSADQDNVWCGGVNGEMIYSNDAGKNWKETTTRLEFTINDIHFVDNKLGYAAGSEGHIVKSIDGGKTWQTETNVSSSDMLSIHFTDHNRGWACGTKNTILVLEIIGEERIWTIQTIFNELAGTTWRDIFFIDDQTGWVIGDAGLVYRSEDGGLSWEKETTGTFSNLNAIHMVDKQHGWIVGEEGTILHYTPLSP